jgi:hypothetical protein
MTINTEYLVMGDTGRALSRTVENDVGVAQDLTGATVELQWWLAPGGTMKTSAMTVDADPETGRVTYQWQVDDFGEPGLYLFRIVATLPAGVVTFPSRLPHRLWVEASQT